MILRGYAIVFNSPAAVLSEDDAIFEQVFEGAFDEMLARREPVSLQFGTHDPAPAIATTGDGTLRLFSDAHGLGFEADTGGSLSWDSALSIVRGGVDYASVNFTRIISQVGIASTRFISRAEIDHITITSHPAYRQTAVWRADGGVEYASSRIRDAAARWEDGWSAWLRAEARARSVSKIGATKTGQHPNPRVAAMIAGKASTWAMHRSMLFQQGKSGIFGHVCLSKFALWPVSQGNRNRKR